MKYVNTDVRLLKDSRNNNEMNFLNCHLQNETKKSKNEKIMNHLVKYQTRHFRNY